MIGWWNRWTRNIYYIIDQIVFFVFVKKKKKQTYNIKLITRLCMEWNLENFLAYHLTFDQNLFRSGFLLFDSKAR